MDEDKKKEEKEKVLQEAFKEARVFATDLYVKVLQSQIDFCNSHPSNYGILYDKGFKDGLHKSIDIILKVRREVNKNEEDRNKNRINQH